MAYKLEITFEAETETQNAVDYYQATGEIVADRFLEDLRRVYSKVAYHPLYYKYIPRRQHNKFRYTKLKSFPFIVIFRVEENSVVIYRVFNTYRKPKYI